jgi:hypothetical protein
MNLAVIDSPLPGLIIVGLLGTLGIFIYFLPSIVASSRDLPHANFVFVVNVFLGWSFFGWVIAMVMACRSQPTPPAPVTQAALPPRTPPGWYIEPVSHSVRQWDGTTWVA